MKPGEVTYQNLLIAAAELHYLAAEENCCEAKARKTVLAFELERCARDYIASKRAIKKSKTKPNKPELRIVYDASTQIKK